MFDEIQIEGQPEQPSVTPETDRAEFLVAAGMRGRRCVDADFARALEKKKNEAVRMLKIYTASLRRFGIRCF